MAAYAQIAVARPLDSLLTYSIPAPLLGAVGVGHVVLVPLGNKGGETGYVVGLVADPGFDPAKVKPISRLLDEEPAFDARQLGFFQWIADYYLAPLGLVIQTALPSRIRARVLRVVEATEAGADALAAATVEGAQALVLREVLARPGLTARGLARRLAGELEADAVKRASAALMRAGLCASAERELSEARGKVRTVTLALPVAEAKTRLGRVTARADGILSWLERAEGPTDLRLLLADLGETARSTLQRFEQKGIVRYGEREDREDRLDIAADGPALAPDLNPDQRAALAALIGNPEGAYLLFGVTGSGKTEVFLGAAESVLEKGRQVLVLVPEIGLTPQLVGRFRARFGPRVAVLHSGLTGAERLAQWRRIRAGEADVAVGARSALFAPFRDLGLVVVDEEHDDSYKQDEGVSYHARDLAVVLGKRHHAVVVLASATPSLESWHNAVQGRYSLLRLPKRATPRPVPEVSLLDLSEEQPGPDGTRATFRPEVVDALRETFAVGGKAIVLYNRRGFATMVQCTDCGGTYECPNCGISLTLHRSAQTLACHYCGFKRPFSKECPACHRQTMAELGKGTERVEDDLAALFPDVRRLRMDADTTAVRGSHRRILDAFRAEGPAMLVGTQIIAKGHDFPDVHVAVVVSADHGLRMPDFRASERTYALLVQAAGRAGRGDVPGRVFLQTWKPDHPVLLQLSDIEGFFADELRIRATLRYPPFSRLVLVRLEGVERGKVAAAAGELARRLRATAQGFRGVDLLGPAAAALPKRVGRWRFQIVLRGRETGPFRQWIGGQRSVLLGASGGGVRVSVDVDPRDLL